MNPTYSSPRCIAAFDFGSNSFHAAVAQTSEGRPQSLLRVGERVQLAAGIRDNRLDRAAIDRGLSCIRRFKAQVTPFQPNIVRAVATHAVRICSNASDFLQPAEDLLQCPIDVISGDEEARLIYSAVADEYASGQPRVVIDVGGGSTELILGHDQNIQHCDSLDIGCLTLRERFFNDAGFCHKQFADAVWHVRHQLSAVSTRYAANDDFMHIGTSGSLQAIADILHQHFDQPAGLITRDALLSLPQQLAGPTQGGALNLQDLDAPRRTIFSAGLAIATALFLQLGISQLRMARSDLRDGVLLDLAKKAHNAPQQRSQSASNASHSGLSR